MHQIKTAGRGGRITGTTSVVGPIADVHEAMSMINRSMTKPVGNKGRTAWSIRDSVNMDGVGMKFGNIHQAPFELTPIRTWGFYEILLDKLGYTSSN